MGDFHDLFKRDVAVNRLGVDQVCDSGRLWTDRGLDLVCGAALVVADRDEPCPADRVAAVVRVALGLQDDDLVRHARRIGQLGHLLGVVACQAGARAQGEGGTAPRCYVGGLGADEPGDVLPGLLEELLHRDVSLVRLVPGLGNRPGNGRPSYDRPVALRVDDGPDTHLLVYACRAV